MNKNDNTLPFVCTFQEDIAKLFLDNGYTLMKKESNGIYIFINNGTMKFSGEHKDKETKVYYTNMLCMTE